MHLLAFVTRYSSTSLREAYTFTTQELVEYAEAIGSLLKDEAKMPGGAGR